MIEYVDYLVGLDVFDVNSEENNQQDKMVKE